MLRSLYHRAFGDTVLSGPFRGMHYIASSVGSVHLAKLVGTYECELAATVTRLVARAPDAIANIGAAEGFYAVGLARRLPGARVIAFELEAHGRDLIGQLAGRNGVSARVEIRGAAAPGDLEHALAAARRPCVVIDAEGAEADLLDPVRDPVLRRCDILVEVHDFIAPLGDLLLSRFAATHRPTEIWSHPRCPSDLPLLLRAAALTPWRSKVLTALDEGRPGPMRWFWLETLAR